jgi:hypothetical protein
MWIHMCFTHPLPTYHLLITNGYLHHSIHKEPFIQKVTNYLQFSFNVCSFVSSSYFFVSNPIHQSCWYWVGTPMTFPNRLRVEFHVLVVLVKNIRHCRSFGHDLLTYSSLNISLWNKWTDTWKNISISISIYTCWWLHMKIKN